MRRGKGRKDRREDEKSVLIICTLKKFRQENCFEERKEKIHTKETRLEDFFYSQFFSFPTLDVIVVYFILFHLSLSLSLCFCASVVLKYHSDESHGEDGYMDRFTCIKRLTGRKKEKRSKKKGKGGSVKKERERVMTTQPSLASSIELLKHLFSDEELQSRDDRIGRRVFFRRIIPSILSSLSPISFRQRIRMIEGEGTEGEGTEGEKD